MKKTVLITGCSSGFGVDIARTFARHGWNVAASMRTPKPLDDLFVPRLDVEDRSSIDDAVAKTVERFGSIDVLVNNAGFGLYGVFEETPRERLAEQFAVNVFGVMDVTRAVLPFMRQRRSGVIVNVGSAAGVIGFPVLSAYCASKFALEGWSEALAYELSGLGITVKIMEPGGVVETRFGERSAAEAAKTVAIPDYAPFAAHAGRLFDGMRKAPGLSSSADVANAIFAAATDGTARLRYVPTNDVRPLVEARRQTSEDAYVDLVRSTFLPKG